MLSGFELHPRWVPLFMVKVLPVMGLSRPRIFETRLFLKADFEGNFKKLRISLRRATAFERARNGS